MTDEIKELANKPYRPSNGSEGDWFQGVFCEKCIFDDYENDIYCDILGDSMAFNIDDKEYPKEWVYDNSGRPICTKFEENKELLNGN